MATGVRQEGRLQRERQHTSGTASENERYGGWKRKGTGEGGRGCRSHLQEARRVRTVEKELPFMRSWT